MKKIILIISFLLFTSCIENIARPVSINLMPYFGNQKLKLEENYPLNQKDSIRFNVLRFYVSTIKLFKNEICVFSEQNSYHLIDASEISSMNLITDVPDSISFNRITFNLGIDSITNNAGVMGGDLDPTKGMYWTWQSGYINFKLEGVSPKCTTRNHEFQFHLGGFSNPYNSLRKINLTVSDREININLDLKKFIEGINLVEHTHVMSPGAEAMDFSTLVASCFKLIQL